MRNQSVKKLTLAAILLAIVIVMQLIKNISPYISGPIINTVMVIAVLELGLWWGVGFSVIVPVLSLVFAPASAMTMLSAATNFLTLPIIMIGNVLLVLAAKLAGEKKLWIFICALVAGAVAKWLFMWLCGEWVLLPLFAESLGKLAAVVTKVFSTLQLYSGLLSIVLIVPVRKALEKIRR